jgi:hypothetical protein
LLGKVYFFGVVVRQEVVVSNNFIQFVKDCDFGLLWVLNFSVHSLGQVANFASAQSSANVFDDLVDVAHLIAGHVDLGENAGSLLHACFTRFSVVF